MLNELEENKQESKKLAPQIKELIEDLEKARVKIKQENKESIKIYSSKVVESAAFIYEKVRNIIDYQDEHILRLNAIERILWRRIRLSQFQDNLSLDLLKELIRAGYIKNEMVSEEKINQSQEIILRYLKIIKPLAQKIKRYFISIAAVEIENILVDNYKVNALVKIIHKTIKKDLEEIHFPYTNKPDFDDQLLIAIYKIFLKSDKSAIRYELLNKENGRWENLDQQFSFSELPVYLYKIKQKIEKKISLANASPLIKVAQIYNPAWLILQNIIQQNPNVVKEILENPKKLDEEVNAIVKDRYQGSREKLKRGIIRATIFIFFTKMLLGIILEIPYDLYLFGSLNTIPLSINLIFPPLLMFSTYFLIYIPEQRNTDRLVRNLQGIVYNETNYDTLAYKIKPRKRGAVLGSILNFLYLVTILGSFALLIWILYILNYNLMGAIVFFFFLSIVSFFAFRLRQSAIELVVTEEKEGFWASLIDFFFLPFLRIGHWISIKFTNWNIFLFILDFIIEAPFKIILDILEHWSAFIREKKEEMM